MSSKVEIAITQWEHEARLLQTVAEFNASCQLALNLLGVSAIRQLETELAERANNQAQKDLDILARYVQEFYGTHRSS
jgi:hypothetical protein